MANTNTNNNQPVAKYKLGALRAAIWKNETQFGPQFSVSFSRIYKKGDDWRETGSFRRDDLLPLQKLADQAYGYIIEQQHNGTQPAASNATAN